MRSFEELLEDLSSADPEVRRQAALQMMWTDDRRAVQPLIHLLDDESPRVRAPAALALSHFESPEAVPALVGHLKDGSGHVRAMCAMALSSIGGEDALDALAATLGDPDWHVLTVVSGAFGRHKHMRALPAIQALLDHPDWHVRLSACETLVDLEVVDARVVETLDLLRQSPEAVEYEQGMTAAHDFMQALISDPDLAEEVTEFDGREVSEESRRGLRETLEAARLHLSEDEYPERPENVLGKLAERARRVLENQQ